MSTVSKESRVISRAVRVLDEIESRIHELREELEAQGHVAPTRGKKSQRDAAHEADEDGDEHEPHAQGRAKHPEADKRAKGKADHDGEGDEPAHNKADDEHEPHAQGRVKHPESDKRLKANKD